jgi:hypothetical protein
MPEIVGNDYLVVGTLEKSVWKRGTQQPLTLQEMLEALHDFKDVVTFKLIGGWVRDEKKHLAKIRGAQAWAGLTPPITNLNMSILLFICTVLQKGYTEYVFSFDQTSFRHHYPPSFRHPSAIAIRQGSTTCDELNFLSVTNTRMTPSFAIVNRRIRHS